MEWLERLTKSSGTHGEITKYAFAVLKDKGVNIENQSHIIAASNDPDETPFDLWVGHFYGNQRDTKKGSYVPFFIDGVELNAVNNFVEWFNYTKATTNPLDKAKETGSTLHYIQDLTAPHHFHNLPAKISKNLFGWDTHSDFENRADELFKGGNAFLNDAMHLYAQQNQVTDPMAFAIEINNKALAIVPDKNSLKPEFKGKTWDDLIGKLIPLAIAASAKVMEELV